MPCFSDMRLDEAGDLHISQVFRAPKSVDDEAFSFSSDVSIPTGHSIKLHLPGDGTTNAFLTNEQGKSIKLRIDACKSDYVFQHRPKSLTFRIFRDADGLKAKEHLIEELPKYLEGKSNADHLEAAYFVGHLYQLAIDRKLLPDIRNPEYDHNLLQIMRGSKPKYKDDFTEFWKGYVKREDQKLQAQEKQSKSSTVAR